MPAKTPRAAGQEPPAGALFVADVLAANVRSYRLIRRLEQADVAERMTSLGQPWRPVTVSEVELGRRNVTVPELVALVLVLGVTVEGLLDPRGPSRSGPQLVLTASGEPIPPDGVTGLVCAHKVYTEVEWQGCDDAHVPRLMALDFYYGRPELTDLGPEEPRKYGGGKS